MLQHRGRDSAGMVTLEGQKFIEHKANGLVKDVFNNQKTMDKLKGMSPWLLDYKHTFFAAVNRTPELPVSHLKQTVESTWSSAIRKLISTHVLHISLTCLAQVILSMTADMLTYSNAVITPSVIFSKYLSMLMSGVLPLSADLPM